ncbi:hypothetical protein M3Y97_00071900 [Aphelenchoides bicaudatus]|nr:hypothetical protein M3Y97_00071900 [Aphelenchoides bicaudatus]
MELLLFLVILKSATALSCFEGVDCEKNSQCDECDGIACVRVARPRFRPVLDTATNTKTSTNFIGNLLRDDNIDFHGPNAQVALTCLPESASIFELDSEAMTIAILAFDIQRRTQQF